MKERKIPEWVGVAMTVVALMFDVTQALLQIIPLAGQLLGMMITPPAFATFYIWFKMYGMSFISPKRALTMGGVIIIELIPLLGALPGWTVAVILMLVINKSETVSNRLNSKNTEATQRIRQKFSGNQETPAEPLAEQQITSSR